MLQIAGKNLTQIPKQLWEKSKSAYDMVLSVILGNSTEPEFQKTIVNVLAPNIKEVTRVDGTRIPVEHHNVYFTKGTFTTDVPEFGHKLQSYKLMTTEGYNATVFKHEVEEILDAENNNIDLLAINAKTVERYSKVYNNLMKPAKRLIALLAGHSDANEIPAEKTSTDGYASDWGALRGESNDGVLNATKLKFANTSHYRGIKGSTLKITDIFDCAELIKSYNTYSGDDVVALASAKTIYELGSLYSAPVNVDERLIDGTPVRNVAGVKFIEIPNMSDEFIVFYDSGASELLLHCVNKSENQRGLALITEKDLKSITRPEDVNGMKLRVYPEEFVVFKREGVVVLDIARQAKTGSGKDGWMADAGATALNAFIKQIRTSYENEAK